jgi:hypothetical protein
MAAPADLAAGSRGRRLWNRTMRDYDLAPVERELLAEVCRVLNRLDELREAAGPEQPRLLIEERQQRMVFSRLLGQLNLPDDGGDPTIYSGASVRGRRAAHARWRGHHG